MKIVESINSQVQAEALAKQVTQDLQAAIAARGTAKFSCSGGSTPLPFLQALREHEVAWNKVSVCLTDERQVPLESNDSNEKMLREELISHCRGIDFVPLFERPDYTLEKPNAYFQGSFLPLDVSIVGMGTDGHFASLFPDATESTQGLDPKCQTPILQVKPASTPQARVSLSLTALLSSKDIYLLIRGSAKTAIIQEAEEKIRLDDWQQALPIQHLIAQAASRLTIYQAP